MPSYSMQSNGDSFWDQLQTAVEETSTWAASTWTTWGASGGGHTEDSATTQGHAPLRTKGSLATRTALSSRSISYVPEGDEEPSFERSPAKPEQGENDNTAKSTQLPVKFTFIHFDEEREHQGRDKPPGIVRQSSAPGVLCTVPFSEQLSPAERSHWKGTCKPCAYFHNKADSCRRGEDCEFCHICRPEEQKGQKRAKKKALRIAHENRKALWGRKSWGNRFSQTWSEGVDPSSDTFAFRRVQTPF